MPSVVPSIISFKDRALAARSLAALYEAYVTSGSVFPVNRFAGVVEDLLADSPDPDLALVNLLRFVEASFSRAALFNDLVQYRPFLELLLTLFASSRYLADILVREPELFRWLTGGDLLDRPLDPAELREEFRRPREMFSHPDRMLDAVKRIHRRAILRIGAQDLLGRADVASVTAQLSDLADAVLDAVLDIASLQLRERLPASGVPAAPGQGFAVLALGKLGGRELNFSSDIDILLVYTEDGTVKDREGREVSSLEYYNRLAELLVQDLSEPTAEGHLYRVDTRLRPESGMSPLARSLQSYLLYYESRGELWERQMLIKARPAAGDLKLGREFVRQLQPFIYPRTFFHHPADAVARIKARIEAKIGDQKNIKLRAGGIRDIEFIVQVLQLVNGGKHPDLREGNTLQAIAALQARGFLSGDESTDLTRAYTMFRTLEHRLQIMANLQTHTVPDDPQTLSALARRLGFLHGPALGTALNRHLNGVRALFDQVMNVRSSTREGGIKAVIDGSLSEEEAAGVLAGFGLADLRGAARAIRALTGTSLSGQQDLDARTRASFREIAPEFFQEVAETPDPDLTLRDFSLLAASQTVPRQLFDALGHPGFRRLILEIASMSPRLVRGLARNPLLLDAVIANVQALAEGLPMDLPHTGNLLEFKNYQELRSGLRYILRFTPLTGLTGELASLADFVVTTVITRETRRARKLPLAVFALGKFGTRELNFDADLDLLFIAAPASAARQTSIEQAASSLMGQLSAVSEKGRLYQVDARLRPEGRNAPLVTDLPAYGEYLQRRASFWERQSLTRARFVCGDRAVGEEAGRLIQTFAFESPLPPGWVGQIETMRKKMETRHRTRGESPLDIKLGPGGMADIEFMVQMIQLKHGPARPPLRFGSTPALLAREDLPELTDVDRSLLLETYLWFRKTETLLRLTLEEKTSLLPEGPKLETLSRCAERMDGRSFRTRVETSMIRVRELFESFCRRLTGENNR